MQADGKMLSGVMICAEALGAEEAKQSKALVGPSGFLLGRIMNRRRWTRDDFRFVNVLWCQPFKNTIRDQRGFYLPWAEEAIMHCPYLDEEIDRLQPKVIVALGETAFERLTGERLPMMAARGYVFPERKGRCWVVPTFHPAFVLRGNQHLAMVLRMDMEKAVGIAQEGFEYDQPECLEDPPIVRWNEFVDRGLEAVRSGKPLAVDIETPFKRDVDEDELEIGQLDRIDRVSFAYEGNCGVSVLWGMPYLPGIRALIEAAQTLVIWNRAFDRPRIMAALNIVIPVERTRDTMDAWHVLYNALPKKLGFATSLLPGGKRLKAWKHLGSLEPAYYSAMDAVALWRDDQDVMMLLQQTGQMGVFEDICVRLDPVLERMSLAGMLVDGVRQEELRGQVEVQLGELLGQMTQAAGTESRQLKVWKTPKAAVKGLELLRQKLEVLPEDVLVSVPGTMKVKVCAACGEVGVKKPHVTRKTIRKES